MSFADRLDKIVSEAPVQQQARAPQQASKDNEFASVRKSIRRPITNLDAAIHEIDKMLNATQQDPSALGNNVTQIEKSFNTIFEPIQAVRDGITKLRQAVDKLEQSGFEYVGQKPAGGVQAQQPAKQSSQIDQGSPDEDRFLNRVATDVEMSNRQEDKLAAAKQGFEAYTQGGGKMKRGDFFRRLAQKLRLPGEAQEQAQPGLPDPTGAKQYGAQGKRRGPLQFKGRSAPIESSVQRRKLIKEGPNKHYNLGSLQQSEPVDEGRLLNKIVTNIEMVNNPADKQGAFRNGWLEYQEAGGKMDNNSFTQAVLKKLSINQHPQA